MFGMQSGLNLERIVAGYAVLLLFGALYNLLIAWLQKQGYDEGLTGIEVIGGTWITLLVTFVMLWGCAFNAETLLITFGAFGSSGIWMALGSLGRYAKRRQASIEALRREVERHD